MSASASASCVACVTYNSCSFTGDASRSQTTASLHYGSQNSQIQKTLNILTTSPPHTLSRNSPPYALFSYSLPSFTTTSFASFEHIKLSKPISGTHLAWNGLLGSSDTLVCYMTRIKKREREQETETQIEE